MSLPAATSTRTVVASALSQVTLEQLVTAPQLGGLPASDHQRLLCRVAQGVVVADVAPITGYDHEVCQRSGSVYMLGRTGRMERPLILYMLSGIRTGKSLITASLALRAALTCDLSSLRSGEVARVSVLSLRRDLAAVVREHLDGLMGRSALLGAVMSTADADVINVVHPSGRTVEIVVVAGARAGAAVVARWSAGVVVDEAPRYAGADEGVVNLEDLLAAARGRLLPGAQVVLLGSPWAARGPVYDAVQEHWHRPSAEVAVVRCSAPAMNPAWWTPKRVVEVQAANPTAYTADVLGEFVELSTDALPSHDIDACRGDYQQLDPGTRYVHVAAIDPALRLNAWTLVVARRGLRGEVEVALARQWMPVAGRSLDPDEVMAEVAAAVRPYGCSVLYSDQHQALALTHIARQQQLMLAQVDLDQGEKCQLVAELAARLALRQVRLPDVAQLCDDLRRVRRIATSGRAGLRIELPSTADGRHCDYVPALLLCMRHLVAPRPERGDVDADYNSLVRKHRRLGLVRRSA